MTQNQENIAIAVLLVLILVGTAMISMDAHSATVDENGRLTFTEEEYKFCLEGGGCQLISAYQIDILTKYVKQLEADLKKQTECPKPGAHKVKR